MFLNKISDSLLRKIRIVYLTPRYLYSTSSTLKEAKIRITNYEINFLRAGKGPHHVFFAPGLFGTINDFKRQIKGFDLEKFTLIVWDPPGFGKSIDLLNKEPVDLFDKEADVAYEFFTTLGIPSFSAVGWSQGGFISLILAIRHPELINKIVTCGVCTYFYQHELEKFKSLSNINIWPKQLKDANIKIYGENNFKKKVNRIVEKRQELYALNKNICDQVKNIKCPTLILHGAKDGLIDSRHAFYLKGLLENSRIYIYPDGQHHMHMQYADDFNKRVQDFLLEPCGSDN